VLLLRWWCLVHGLKVLLLLLLLQLLLLLLQKQPQGRRHG
jgi:hypothetical protein